MMMTDDEIRSNWRNSAKDRAQIGNLAELNGIPLDQMTKKMLELKLITPEDVAPKPVRKKRSVPKQAPCMDTQVWAGVPGDTIRALWGKDLADIEIMEALVASGYRISVSSVARWRHDNELPPHGTMGSKPKSLQAPRPAAATPVEPLTLTALVAILMEISENHPDAHVMFGAVEIAGVTVLSRYPAPAGESVEVRLV